MPRFKITVKQNRTVNGIRIEKGMSVEIVTIAVGRPIASPQGQQAIADAFMRIYGIDLRKVEALNGGCLDITQI